jgi:hypothetical protein
MEVVYSAVYSLTSLLFGSCLVLILLASHSDTQLATPEIDLPDTSEVSAQSPSADQRRRSDASETLSVSVLSEHIGGASDDPVHVAPAFVQRSESMPWGARADSHRLRVRFVIAVAALRSILSAVVCWTARYATGDRTRS